MDCIMSSPFLICEFAKATLSNLVKECFGSDFPDINTKKQINYLFNYLRDLEAKTILLESEYIDKDYLEDYSRYYVKCFNRYGERCARLHFFSHEFDHSVFSKVFDNHQETIESIKTNYLGFIVVKPLPQTFIGKTCLALYKSLTYSKDRSVITRTYSANLFGVELKIETVAFQEQDKVISACATTAVWSALQALDKNDTRAVISSSEITLAAINHIENSSNSFPNHGLTNKQILRALDTQGFRNHRLDIEQFDVENLQSIIRIIKSYINSSLPIILGADVYVTIENPDGTKRLQLLAGHAVTILGYKHNENEIVLYLHDDRLGPFARAKILSIAKAFPEIDVTIKDRPEAELCICLQEKDDNGNWKKSNQILIPDSLIIPNNKKVRIPAEFIDNTCESIVQEFEFYCKQVTGFIEEQNDIDLLPELTYEIQLESISKIKNRVLKEDKIHNKKHLLTQSAARFLWSAKFKLENELSLEILFDSTDIPQGNAIVYLLEYNQNKCKAILASFKNLLDSKHALPESGEDNFLSAFIRALKPKEPDAFTYLDEQYGEPRAPKRLKNEEIANSQLQTQTNIKKRYGREHCTIDSAFPNQKADGSFLIWAISFDGALLIGKEIDNKGHPTLTGFKPARIAGELINTPNGWMINSKSGRYSRDYENVDELLINAREKFLEVFNEHAPSELNIIEFEKKK